MESTSHSFGIVLQPNTYYFVESNNDKSEMDTLEKIEFVVKNQLNYDVLHQDSYSELPQKELFTLLQEKSLQIHREMIRIALGIFKKRSQIEELVLRIGYCIHPANGLFPADIIGELSKYLNISDLLNLSQLNRQSKDQVASYFFSQRKAFGYEGKNVTEVFNFAKQITSLFKEITDLSQLGYIPRKHVSFKNNYVIEPEKTFQNLLKISTPDLFEILSFGQIYSASYPNYKRFFNQTRSFTILEITSDTVKSNGSQALYYASQRNESEIVKLLLKHHANPNFRIKNKGNALNAAVQEGFDEIVKILLEAGADVNAQADGTHTALMYACYHKDKANIKVVELLLQLGANTNIKGKTGLTALDLAKQNQLHYIASLLRKHDAH